MKKCIIPVIALAFDVCCFAEMPTITGVTAQQRYPWNGKVDISYTVTGDIAEAAKYVGGFAHLKVSAVNRAENTTNVATRLSGDMALTEGTHTIIWDMEAEGLTFKSTNIVFKVICETTPATYCVINLSAGSNASAYPVTYLDEPPSGGFNVNAYKTTKLVLQRIEGGTFIMGDDQNDESHRVMLTKPFFCGLFEVTQKQYSLVMGSNPSTFTGDKRPVELSYNQIRGSSSGAQWPSSSSVDTSSFLGKLRARTGLDFDLPTEAQWEYACRAGTTSKYNNGGNSENDLKKLGRYSNNYNDGKGGGYTEHVEVGSYQPNAYGLYDMHGNVNEWCLDWKGELVGGTDPLGPSTGTRRDIRGGAFTYPASSCGSSNRPDCAPSGCYSLVGVRLFITLME